MTLKKKSPALLKTSEKARQVASNGKVGKGSPPEAFKWRPGQSGNPSGKPSAHREVIVASVKAMLAQGIPNSTRVCSKGFWNSVLVALCRARSGTWACCSITPWASHIQRLEHSGGIDLSEVIRKARERDPDLPAETPRGGHSDAGTVLPATDAVERGVVREDDAEQAAPATGQRPIRRIVVM